MDFTSRRPVKRSLMVGHTSRAPLGLQVAAADNQAKEGQGCFKRSMMQALTAIITHTLLHLDYTGITFHTI